METTFVRLDVLLTRRNLAVSRTEARAAVEAGLVTVQGKPAAKSSQLVREDADVAMTGQARRFVSRGGKKLEAAFNHFNIPVKDTLCLDVGASTGGFTDCLLQRGAAHVTAIDVGHGQMDPRIAGDPRVDSREGINARGINAENFEHPFDIVVADLSFVSLRLVLPALFPLLRPEGDTVCLVKPQFEVGREALGKGGIVRGDTARRKALRDVADAALQCGFTEMGSMESPLPGGDGNIEFLLWLRRSDK